MNGSFATRFAIQFTQSNIFDNAKKKNGGSLQKARLFLLKSKDILVGRIVVPEVEEVTMKKVMECQKGEVIMHIFSE